MHKNIIVILMVLASAGFSMAGPPPEIDTNASTECDGATTVLTGDNTCVDVSSVGNVTKVGTPADGQVGVWTGDGTIEGDAALTFDTSSDSLFVGDPAGVNFAMSPTLLYLYNAAGTGPSVGLEAAGTTGTVVIYADSANSYSVWRFGADTNTPASNASISYGDSVDGSFRVVLAPEVASDAASIAYLFDTTNSLAAGKLASWKNQASEKAYIDYSGLGSFAGGITDGTATLSSGALSGVTTIVASGAINGLIDTASYTSDSPISITCKAEAHVNGDNDTVDFELEAASTVGLICAFSEGGFAQTVVVDPNGTDVLVIDGTALTAGNAADSPAEGWSKLVCTVEVAGYWNCVTAVGTSWADGGAD